MQSDSINELAAALAKAQGEMENAKKDVTNAFFKSKYADLASVIDAAKQPLAKNGLSVVQYTITNDAGDVVLFTQLNHSSGQWISGTYPIKPVKNDPQGMGSAITYARRYTFSAIVGIASEDDDGNAASGKDAPRSVFENSAARNVFSRNVIDSFLKAVSPEKLAELIELNSAKFAEMEKSGDGYDSLALGEIRKQYKIRLESFKAAI